MRVSVVTAGKYCTGVVDEGGAEMVCRCVPARRRLGSGMGGVCLALGVYGVVGERALAKFRAKGPMM